MLIAGGNDNIVEGNYIFDNWRRGTMLHWVPSSFRGEPDPAKGFDTSNNNAYVGQLHGHPARRTCVRPNYSTCQGIARRERRRLLVGRGGGPGLRPRPARLRRHRDRRRRTAGAATSARTAGSRPPTRRVAAGMPRLRQRLFKFPNINKLLELLPCASWDPQTNTDPPGCDWFTRRPSRTRAADAPSGRTRERAASGPPSRFGRLGNSFPPSWVNRHSTSRPSAAAARRCRSCRWIGEGQLTVSRQVHASSRLGWSAGSSPSP